MSGDMPRDDTARETVLMAVKKKWVENGHVHLELFAPENRFVDTGIPEECAILEIPPGELKDWSLLSDTGDREAER